MTVECSNCGGIGAEVWLSLAALLLAGVAGWYAKRSADHAKAAVDVASEELALAREEHAEFLRQLRARARFKLSLGTIPEPDDDGVIRADATVLTVRLEVVLKNDGDRAASETVLNVVAPRALLPHGFRWCGPNGEELPGVMPRAETAEELTDAEGKAWPGQYVSKALPRVNRRASYASFVWLAVELPRSGERSVPLKVTAQADELPDDVDEEVEHLMVRVALAHRA